MKDSPKPDDLRLNPVQPESVLSLRAQFEAAWQQALRGGQPPALDAYLERVSAAERTSLLQELDGIHVHYRQLVGMEGSRGDATLDFPPSPYSDSEGGEGRVSGADTAHAQEGTIDEPLEAGHASHQDGTIDLPPTVKATQSSVRDDATIDEPPEFARTPQRDPDGDGSSATLDFTPARPLMETIEGKGRRYGNADFSLAEGIETETPGQWPVVPGYEILGELGRGGMGVVYKARQMGLNRLVALKMVLAGAHAGQHQLLRFHTEAEAVARLQNPNIVQIYDVGKHDGLPYFSLEFVDGGCLSDKINHQPQPPREAAAMIETLARAMQSAHVHGIIHRDLKPANVLLTKDGVPKITDFGLAKRLEGDSSQTKSGTLMGTPSYMAPEQARGDIHLVGPLADVYALGAMLYELITGRPPFLGANPMDTVMLVTREEPVPPTRLQPQVPHDLETICLKCLQKESTKRYATALELAEDLRRFLEGEPILARPVGNAERLWRWCKRNPKLAAATAAIALLLLVVSIGSTWAAFAIHEQKTEAVKAKNEAVTEKDRAERNEVIAIDQADLALQTLGLLINKVQQQLSKDPGMQPLKKALLQTALDGLKRVANKGATEGKTLLKTQEAFRRMGEIALEFGNSKEAYEYFKSYYELTSKALESQPDDVLSKARLSRACTSLGQISAQIYGEKVKELEYYQKALELRKEVADVPAAVLRERNSRVPEEEWVEPFFNKLMLSECYTRLGLYYYYLGDSAQAEKPILKSLTLREELVAEYITSEAAWAVGVAPSSPGAALTVAVSMPPQVETTSGHRMNLTRNYHLMGEIYFRLGNLARSRANYDKCVAIREELLKSDPKDFRLKGDLGQLHQYYGDMLVRLRAPLPEALFHYDRAIQLTRDVVAIDKSIEYKQMLADACFGRGVAMLRMKDKAEAQKYFDESLKIREELLAADSINNQKRVEMMLVLPRCGQHERAAGLAETVAKAGKNNGELLFDVGRCFAQCSVAAASDSALRARYEQRSLAALEDAVRQGFKDVAMLDTEPDLDPIRRQPDFTKLVETVKRKSTAVTQAKS